MALVDMMTRALCAHLDRPEAELHAQNIVTVLDLGDSEMVMKQKIWDALATVDVADPYPVQYRDEMVGIIYSMYQREAQHELSNTGRSE